MPRSRYDTNFEEATVKKTSNKQTISAARAVVNVLLRERIDHVFGIPGTQNLAILDILRETPQIRFILTRHEQGAAFMAHGYARAKLAPAVVTATEGPGLTNLATGIAAALKGYAPVVSICGVQEGYMRDRDSMQDIDQADFMRPITKWAKTVETTEKVQELLRKAFRIAMAEPKGPTHIDVSSDVLHEDVEAEDTEPASYRSHVLPTCDACQLDEVAALLAQARRPVFLVGRGVINERAGAAMAELASQTGIPVAALQYTPDAFPIEHALALGALGRNGAGSANRIVPQADLIVAVGAHIDVFSSTFKYGIFNESAKLVHHSSAAGQIGIVFPVTVGVTGSTASFIAGLAERAQRAGLKKSWVDVPKARAEWEVELNAKVNHEAVPIQSQFVAYTIRKALPRNGICVVDAGNGGKHVRSYFKGYEPNTFMCMDDWAAVGGSFPMALGAKLAQPDRPVLCASGDGGAMCNIGELETAVRENIPVVYVIFNDSGLGNERAFQNERYNGRFFAVDYNNPNFAELARVFGAHGEQVTKPGDLEGAIARAFASGKPAVIDVIIDQHTLAPVVFRPEA
jgi:thiamine pyrophosphate-dependent acetolactate synthase large subunit-like protein